MDVNENLSCEKSKIFFFGGTGRGSGWEGGQDRCERRIEVFVKIQKNIIFFFFGGGGGVFRFWGQGGCERRIFVKIQKNERVGSGGRVGGRVGGSGWM